MDEPPVTIYVQHYDLPLPRRPLTTGEWRHETEWPLARGQERTFHLAERRRPERRSAGDRLRPRDDRLPPGRRHDLRAVRRLIGGADPARRPAPRGRLVPDLDVAAAPGTPRDPRQRQRRPPRVGHDGRRDARRPAGRRRARRRRRTRHQGRAEPDPPRLARAALAGRARPCRTTSQIPLEATSWVFEPGHAVRIAVTGADYPLLWPSPTRTT